MEGAGHGGTVPDFQGTDMSFYVKDPNLDGGGFMDTLSNTWNKVKQFITESPLAQKVVNEGIAKGKKVARGIADDLVDEGIDKLPGFAQGAARSLAGQALDKLENAAERRAEEAIIGQTPTSAPAVPNTPVAPVAPGRAGRSVSLRGSGADPFGMIELNSGVPVSAVPWDNEILGPGSTVVPKTNALMAY